MHNLRLTDGPVKGCLAAVFGLGVALATVPLAYRLFAAVYVLTVRGPSVRLEQWGGER